VCDDQRVIGGFEIKECCQTRFRAVRIINGAGGTVSVRERQCPIGGADRGGLWAVKSRYGSPSVSRKLRQLDLKCGTTASLESIKVSVSDIIYGTTLVGWLYWAIILELFSRKVVG
jgi:transposase InsO family protein